MNSHRRHLNGRSKLKVLEAHEEEGRLGEIFEACMFEEEAQTTCRNAALKNAPYYFAFQKKTRCALPCAEPREEILHIPRPRHKYFGSRVSKTSGKRPAYTNVADFI